MREWVDFPGATYVEHDGEAEILPGVRLLPAPGHTAGHQIVVVLKALPDGRTEMTFEQHGLLPPDEYGHAGAGWATFFERIDERLAGSLSSWI